jgi:hypothetical protein
MPAERAAPPFWRDVTSTLPARLRASVTVARLLR